MNKIKCQRENCEKAYNTYNTYVQLIKSVTDKWFLNSFEILKYFKKIKYLFQFNISITASLRKVIN